MYEETVAPIVLVVAFLLLAVGVALKVSSVFTGIVLPF